MNDIKYSSVGEAVGAEGEGVETIVIYGTPIRRDWSIAPPVPASKISRPRRGGGKAILGGTGTRFDPQKKEEFNDEHKKRAKKQIDHNKKRKNFWQEYLEAIEEQDRIKWRAIRDFTDIFFNDIDKNEDTELSKETKRKTNRKVITVEFSDEEEMIVREVTREIPLHISSKAMDRENHHPSAYIINFRQHNSEKLVIVSMMNILDYDNNRNTYSHNLYNQFAVESMEELEDIWENIGRYASNK